MPSNSPQNDAYYYCNHKGQYNKAEFTTDSSFSPVTHGKIIGCTSKYNILVPLLKISRVVVIISRTDHFYSVSCALVKDQRVLTYLVIFDADF